MSLRVRTSAILAAVIVVAAVGWWWSSGRWRRAGRAPSPAALPTAAPLGAVPPDSAINGPVADERTLGAYHVRIVEDTASHEKVVDITQAGRRVFARRSADWRIDHFGEHLTGDGQPNFLLIEYTGGLHCCTRGTVLSLGPQFRDYGTIDAADGDLTLDDVDHDGIPEIKVGDFRFAYWRDVPFSDTPVPEVLYRFREGRYEVACDLMREPAPREAALRRQARELARGWTTGDPPVDLWSAAVDYVYSGNPDAAWRLLDLAWPADNPGHDEFIADLKGRLAGSPCWTPGPQRPSA